jgi:serine/threonine protein kinase
MQQLRNTATGEVFARKILRLNAMLRIEDVENEIRAVNKLCSAAKAQGENIVIVIRHGTLSSSLYYFFDMELCNFNLEHYITVLWQPNNLEKMYSGWKTQSTVDWGSRLMEIWIIMSQIAHGVAFMHRQKEVHRDLKPRNGTAHDLDKNKKELTNAYIVLYSGIERRWKIADFGFSSEGSSDKANTSHNSRGTPSYRAPELMNEASGTKYTNKVDIWAMGCILYEILFRKKAFSGDMAVLSYLLSKERPGFPVDVLLDDPSRQLFEKTIYSMLELEPANRPTAPQLVETFSLNPQNLILNNLVAGASLIQTSAVHGSSLFSEDNSWIVSRRGYGATVTPSNTSTHGWLQFPIPTPVTVNNRRMRAAKTIIKLKTGDNAFISAVGIHDGDREIMLVQNIRINGPLQDLVLDIKERPEVWGGLIVSIEVVFDVHNFPERNAGTWVEFFSVAIEFH